MQMQTMSPRHAMAALSIAGVLALACERPPVVWAAAPIALPAPRRYDDVLAADGAPDVRGARWVAAALAPAVPADSGLCRASLRVVAGRGPVWWAAWWAARPDSTVRLRLAQSTDSGRHWAPARTVDDRDRGARGCARPAAAVAADADGAYVHLAYFLEPGDGAGVFYQHLMLVPGMSPMFHGAVPIVFGERAAAVAVAGAHDTVVVAYEDPNRRVSQIGLAISATAGHRFAVRLPVSGEDVAATRPAVALSGHRVVVAWQESPSVDAETADAAPDEGPPMVARWTARAGAIE
jgi:hypothetical protein